MDPLNIRSRSRPLRRSITPWDFKETWINRLLERHGRPTTYLEIGVRWGESLRTVQADRKIGIDPVRQPAVAVLRGGEEFHEMTSDDFFRDRAPEILERGSIEVALIDGLHEFHQALRDLIHLEPYLAPGASVVLDDCNPRTPERSGSTNLPGRWNGDVWKVVPLVDRELDGLRVVTIRGDNGIGIVWGFDGTGRTRTIPEEVEERYASMSYDDLRSDRSGYLRLVPPALRSVRAVGVPV